MATKSIPDGYHSVTPYLIVKGAADAIEFYNDKKLIELVILAGQYKTVAYYQNSLRLPLPEGNMGLLAR